MTRFSVAALAALLGAGLLGCPSRSPSGNDSPTTLPGAGACTLQHATLDVCVETNDAGCTSWGSRKAGSTHQFALAETCTQLGYPNACGDGFMHREACTTGACRALRTCDSCTAQLGCGWCGIGDCNEGTRTGMTSGSCSGWAWEPASCPPPPEPVDPCVAKRSQLCAGCTATPGCGWCPSSAMCVTGTASGPSAGTCPAAAWGTWTVSAASCQAPDPCGWRGASCDLCTALAECGYCASESSCRSARGSCSDWRASPTSCPASPKACSECLSACRGLPGCCTGTGCICDGPC